MSDVLLRCEQIHKSFVLGRTTLPVLRGVSLSVRRGRFLSISGASGSGKSTLLHVMSGLDVPQRGQVYYEGRPIFEPEGFRRIPAGREEVGAVAGQVAGRGKQAGKADGSRQGDLRLMAGRRNTLLNTAFGFVFQFYHLLPEFDVLENVLLPRMVGQPIGGWLSKRAQSADRALELLDRVGLSGRLRHRPSELSGGERQRVAIARALMNKPDLLFADEPTGNLDGKTGRSIFRLLKDLNQAGQTIVMVTHDRELSQETDEVVQIVDGLV